MKVITKHDVNIKLGENAIENTQLVKMANRNHHWVHLERFPSGHVVVETCDPSEELLHEASMLCLARTKYRNMRNVGVSATTIGNLRCMGDGEVEFISARRVRRLVTNPFAARTNKGQQKV